MTVWNIKPGRWHVRQGLDTNDDQRIDKDATQKMVSLERGETLKLDFAPGKNIIIHLELIEPAKTDYAKRADVGIGSTDIKITGNEVTLHVYNLGAINSPATMLQLKDAKGKMITTVPVPPLKAPLDLVPEWTKIKCVVPQRHRHQ